ncbi:ammonium transporter [Capsulimonas corticalis]|uniref:Ammonium transporter n=2 Tax=Capsulimonas corticalis TaxID=2219043 RepID=A0A402CXQ6_9BACT|nr:ammonium transporter [Capsulimonas corticalis]
MLMTPGLAFFYGGLARSKNILSTLMMSFVALGIITIQWVVYGYSVAFSSDLGGFMGFMGDPKTYFMLKDVGGDPVALAPTIPHTIFMMFQMTFAIITPALISGAVVERMKFSAYCLFILLWATFFYDPLAHMVWGGGFISAKLHALDFAGGTVVHISSGVSALILAFMLGKRKGHGSEELRPHNLPMVLTGVALLWFGWFGFNAGSELAADGVAGQAFINTHIATGAAAMSWILIEWFKYKKPSALGFGSGAVAGLVAITPACGFVDVKGALIIGLLVSPICFAAIQMKNKLNAYDDALDVFGVHGCGGMFGALATGLFATDKINSNITGALGSANGVFYGGGMTQFIHQIEAVLITVVLAVFFTFVLGKIVGLITGGLRASADDEENGLDVTEHGEVGYSSDTSTVPAFAGVD